jgi:eukaryotic-like serine/threonine-protein kinase
VVGQVLGHYRIDAKVGEGGFAVVYKGRDLLLERTVALKILKEPFPRDGSTWGRLLREAQIASVLNHPNICSLFDLGEEQDIHYLVCEFVEGKTVRAMLESGPLPTEDVFRYGMQIAEAMAYIHSAGILHRDIRSSNLMITPAGQIKILDFGLAKFVQKLKTGQDDVSNSPTPETGRWVVGALPYAAPELLHGDAATAQASIWSLGVVMFEMLTGELPFAGRTAFELAMDIMTGKPKSLPAEIPGGLRTIVHRCLMPDKEFRYSSAIEVCDHLRSERIAYELRSILARRPPSLYWGYWFQRLGHALTWLTSVLFGPRS